MHKTPKYANKILHIKAIYILFYILFNSFPAKLRNFRLLKAQTLSASIFRHLNVTFKRSHIHRNTYLYILIGIYEHVCVLAKFLF